DGRAAQAERRDDDIDAAAILETRVAQRAGLVDAPADLVHDPLRDLKQMLLVAELDLGQLELALALDVGLLGTVDHDVADCRVGEQLFERPESEQLVDEDLLARELFAPFERDLELGEHLRDDRAEFLRELVLVEGRRRFGVDAFQEAREDLLLDPVDRRLKAFDFAAALFAAGVLSSREAVHGAAGGGAAFREIGFGRRKLVERRELIAAVRRRRGRAARAALHGLGDAKARASAATHSTTLAECAHARWSLTAWDFRFGLTADA